LRDVIAKVLNQNVTLIDSGEATAFVVRNMLADLQLNNTSTLKPNLQFFVSDVPHKFAEIGERFLGNKLGKVHRVEGFLS
jgi:glutamate racemase